MFGVGKYKMRGGGDAEIVAVVNGIAYGFTDGVARNADTWDSTSGSFYFDCSDESQFDLIDPNAKKPIKIEAWVNVYDGRYFLIGGGYSSLDEAKKNTTEGCIAITKVTIDCMEGDNLD